MARNKVQLRLRADVVEHDDRVRLEFSNKEYVVHQIQQLKGHKKAVVTIESLTGSKRSNNQNAYWHGVCFPILAEMTGFTDAEIKQWCKQLYIKPKIKKLNGREIEILRGTSDLSKEEGVEFTENLFSLAESLGGHIPTPKEAGYEDLYGVTSHTLITGRV